MKTKNAIADFWIYKWRYHIGYIGLALVFILVVTIAGFYAPDGLHQAEIRSAIRSSSLDSKQLFSGDNLINLPFNLLQKLTIRLFGLSIFSVKLPAMIFAALAIIALLSLLTIWSTRRAAILASLVVITSSRLMFLSQFGTPTISLIALPLAAVYLLVRLVEDVQILSRRPKLITRRQQVRLWLILLGLAATFSGLMYLPMGGFLVLIILATIAFHPSVRLALRNLKKLIGKAYPAVLAAWTLLLITPIIVAGWQQPSLLFDLLGINFFNFKIIDNLKSNFTEIFFYQPNLSSPFVTAWYSFSALVLIVIGLFQEVKTAHKPRSAMILMWASSGLILTIFSAESHLLLFTPLALALAIGLNHVMTSWYRIFPKNPYARFVGVIPILILVFSLNAYGVWNYIDSYVYHPLVAPQFTNDLSLLDRQPRPFVLVVTPQLDEEAFYRLYAKSRPDITVSTEFNPDSGQTQIATRASAEKLPSSQLKTVLANRFREQSDRFYVYKKTTK